MNYVLQGLSNSSRDIKEEDIKKMRTQQKFNVIHYFQMLISSKL